MRDRYRLGGLGDDELLSALPALVQREHELLSDFLAHLAELDERRLFLDLGYSSFFAYCTDALGLSKSSAGRRIAAARVCRKFPEAFARVARGELQLSVLCELSKYLNAENATALFEACGGKNYELTLEILAARFPKPDVRDSIRRMPVRSAHFTPDIGSGPSAATVAERVNVPDSPAISGAATPATTPVRRAIEPLSLLALGFGSRPIRNFGSSWRRCARWPAIARPHGDRAMATCSA